MIRDMGMKDRKIDRLQKETCLDRAVEKWKTAVLQKKSNYQMNELQQKLDQNDSQVYKLKQLASRYKINEKYIELESAKNHFRERKDLMFSYIGAAKKNLSMWEKNGCVVFETLISGCEQKELPKAGEDHEDGAKLLKKYRHELSTGWFAKKVAGNNMHYYMSVLDFLEHERIDHINKIQGLEKSIKDLAIFHGTELGKLLV